MVTDIRKPEAASDIDDNVKEAAKFYAKMKGSPPEALATEASRIAGDAASGSGGPVRAVRELAVICTILLDSLEVGEPTKAKAKDKG